MSVAAPRKPRADAQRNRMHLLAVAKAAFAGKGPDVSLDEIARMAGVGIGTLYRHFPTRDALVEGVYRNEMLGLAEAADRLAQSEPPLAALREWLLLFVEHIATKQIMATALNSLVCSASSLQAASADHMTRAITGLTDRAVASGDIRMDLDPVDLLRALVGVATVAAGPEWQNSARQLVDILLAGVRVS